MSMLLFGATGHLVRTKLRPRIYGAGFRDVKYVSRTLRDHRTQRSWFTPDDELPQTDVTYFAVNSTTIPYVIDKIPLDTRLCVEKPVGRDYESCRKLMEHLDDRDVVFVDHYLCKNIPVIGNPKSIKDIYVTIHETADVEDLIHSFAEMGIVRDFIQNHVLMVVAKMIGGIETIEPFSKENCVVDYYPGYSGPLDAPTAVTCTTTCLGGNTTIHVDVAKRAERDTFQIILFDHQENCQIFHPSRHNDAYTDVLQRCLEGGERVEIFPSREEVLRCWELVEDIL